MLVIIKEYEDGTKLYFNKKGFNINLNPNKDSGGYSDANYICKIKNKETPSQKDLYMVINEIIKRGIK